MSSPAIKFRDGTLQVTIWRNTGDRGNYYTVNPTRSYKSGDDGLRAKTSFHVAKMVAKLAIIQITLFRIQITLFTILQRKCSAIVPWGFHS